MCTLITWVFVKIQTISVGPGWVRPEISGTFSGGGADAAGLGHYFEEQGWSRVFQQYHCWHSGLSNSLLLGEERAFLCIVRRLAASWLLPLGAHSTTLFPPQPRCINQKCLHVLQNIFWGQNYFLLRAMAPVLFSYARKQDDLLKTGALVLVLNFCLTCFQSCVMLQALQVFKICRCRCQSFLVSNSYNIVHKWGILPPGGSKYSRWVAGTTRFKYMSY